MKVYYDLLERMKRINTTFTRIINIALGSNFFILESLFGIVFDDVTRVLRNTSHFLLRMVMF